jgi:porin
MLNRPIYANKTVFRAMFRSNILSSISITMVVLFAAPAFATPPSAIAPSSSVAQPGQNGQTSTQPTNFFTGIGRRSYLLDDIDGLRTALSKYGISLSILETSELLGNLTGGKQTGADYDGLTQIDLQADTQRAFHHHGGTFNISALQVHGTNLSADNLLSLQTSSGIESDRSTRLWEFWYDQKLLDCDNLDIKIGQQSLDQEYMVSQNADLFVNTMFGWAMVPSADLPGGGPAYPLSDLGVRAAYRPNTSTNILAGIYTGSPTPNNSEDPQKANANGLSFPVNSGALMIAEAQFVYPGLGAMVSAGRAPLPRVIKLGAWYDNEKFADQRFGTDGLSLASSSSNGIPISRTGDYSVYGTVDQMVWHSEDDYERSLNFFGRFMAAPQEDRNLVDYSTNIGLTLTDPFEGRDDDSVGLAFGFAKVGDAASELDKDTANLTQSYYPTRTSETFIEATYEYEVYPWFRLQPDAQYIINPGGGIPNPNNPTHVVTNELVVGLRANIEL